MTCRNPPLDTYGSATARKLKADDQRLPKALASGDIQYGSRQNVYEGIRPILYTTLQGSQDGTRQGG